MAATLLTPRPKLDWVSRHVPENRLYGVKRAIKKVPETAKLWTPGMTLNQGEEGACVGGGSLGCALASPQPRARHAVNDMLFAWYNLAKTVDEYEGVDYDGTSVRAGGLVGRTIGAWAGFDWCFGIDDVIQALIQRGPVIIGIEWRDGMYETRKDGLVKVTGDVVGGHCITLNGFNPKHSKFGRVVRWKNSWGDEYGIKGQGYIRVEDLAELLKHDGEAMVPTGKKTLDLSRSQLALAA